MSNDFGLVTWDEEFADNSRRPQSRANDFMRLNEGHNVMRIITKPYQYWYHKYKESEDDRGYGDKVMCSLRNGSCPLCDQKVRRSRRWFVGVIDRTDGSYKVLDMAKAVINGVQKFSRDEDWGDPGLYDIDVVVDKKGGPQGYYTVIPKMPKPLSPEDVETKKNADIEELERKCAPPTPEAVQKRLDFLNKKNTKGSPKSEEKKGAKPEVEESDDEYSFRAVD